MPVVINGTSGITDVDGTAAAPALTGTDTDTGIFFPAANTIAWSTGGTERMRVDSSGNFQFNSGYGSVATAYGCRAWVNFNGSTATIRASGNVTSVTRAGVGSYSISLTTAMPDTNYCAVMSTTTNASGGLNAWYSSIDSTTVISMGTYSVAGGGAGAYRDTTQISVAVFR